MDLKPPERVYDRGLRLQGIPIRFLPNNSFNTGNESLDVGTRKALGACAFGGALLARKSAKFMGGSREGDPDNPSNRRSKGAGSRSDQPRSHGNSACIDNRMRRALSRWFSTPRCAWARTFMYRS